MKIDMSRKEMIEYMEGIYRKRAKEENWRPSELAMTLAGVPREVDKVRRQLHREAASKALRKDFTSKFSDNYPATGDAPTNSPRE